MDELSEKGKELLRKVLSRGRIAYDSLNEDERRVVDELVRLGYVKLYLEPNGKRIGDALRITGLTSTSHGKPNYMNYLCLVLASLIPLLFLYLSIRSLIMGYALIGVFFLAISAGLAYVIYLITRRRHCLDQV